MMYGLILTHCVLVIADNLINGHWACENNQTQNVELKGYAGYKYAIRSDYGATHSTVASALNGLDQEFPGGATGMFAAKLKAALLVGNVSQVVLDDKVYRVLLSMFAIGLFENGSAVARNHGQQNVNVTSQAHNDVARELATASTVLLKNQGAVLPFQLAKLSKIAVIGGAAAHEAGGGAPSNGEPAGFPISGGGGSGSVMPPYQISVLQAVRARAAAAGHPASAVTYLNGSDPMAAAALAAQADVAIVVVAVTAAEGTDRADLMLPREQSAYVQAVGKSQKATVVVAISPGALLTLVCPPPPPPPPPPSLKGCTVDRDTDYFNAPCADGGCGKPAKTLQECCDQCRAIPSELRNDVSLYMYMYTIVNAVVCIWSLPTDFVAGFRLPFMDMDRSMYRLHTCDVLLAQTECERTHHPQGPLLRQLHQRQWQYYPVCFA